jgi:ABC-type uncharacterized transport system auxiliary subunit
MIRRPGDRHRATRRQWTVLIAVAALAACSFSRPPVERTTYLLTATREAPAASTAKPVAVKVRPMRAVPLYERKEFVYRVDGERVVSDFYNEFAETPESMLTSAVSGWLKNAQLFASVVEPGVPVDAPYALDGSIVALYGDSRDPAKPAAEVAVQFYLVKQRGSAPELVYDRVLRSRVDVAPGNPRALAAGYNQALAQILAQLERDLGALELK